MSDQSVRLECLKLANARLHLDAKQIVEIAAEFERYVTGTPTQGSNTLTLPKKDRR